jgi:propanol-preferring alcohol dehydrogenase
VIEREKDVPHAKKPRRVGIDMKAMILKEIQDLSKGAIPLELATLPDPLPAEGEVRIKISACGVCHTELDEIEGRTAPPRLPVVPGHQVVGRVESIGNRVSLFRPGDRVGVAWIFSTCGECRYCREGVENLCTEFRATGRDVDGGYAQFMTVPESSVYRIPDLFSDAEAAPLLCAGAIGYRSLKLTRLENGQNLGLVGFGASAHIVLMLVKHLYPDSNVFVFARSDKERSFARELGADWAGEIDAESPGKLDSCIDTTPVWRPIVEAMRNLAPGGRLVINAIRKEDVDKEALLRLDYPSHLWLEKEIKSVANVTRDDVRDFLQSASEIPVRPEVQEFPLEDANEALMELKMRKIRGAKVLRIN